MHRLFIAVLLACAACGRICLDGSISKETSDQTSDTFSLAYLYAPQPPPADAGSCQQQCEHLFGSDSIESCDLFEDPDAGLSLTCLHTHTKEECPSIGSDSASSHFDDL